MPEHQLNMLLTEIDNASQGEPVRRLRILAALTRMVAHRGVTPAEAAHFASVLNEPTEDTAGRCMFIVKPLTP